MHFSHLQYYYFVCLRSVSFYIVHVYSSYCLLLFILFMFISPEDQCNAFLGAVSCISVNDCHFNRKRLLGILDRRCLLTALTKDILLLFPLWKGLILPQYGCSIDIQTHQKRLFLSFLGNSSYNGPIFD